MLATFAEQHGCEETMDYEDKMLMLKSAIAETGFKIGVLAGAIFAGCSKKTIDRFERGLTFALRADRNIVRD